MRERRSGGEGEEEEEGAALAALPRPKLSVANHPLPLTKRAATLLRLQLSAATALFLIVPLVLMTGNYAVFIVKERTSQALHVQQLTGLSPAVYWLASLTLKLPQHPGKQHSHKSYCENLRRKRCARKKESFFYIF